MRKSYHGYLLSNSNLILAMEIPRPAANSLMFDSI
ncbi:MAG: hypothetical protein QG574_2540 [Cyanobacteriota bacterium erpe_2018_sw_21hr_WHONDRS-SW48-000092_B_bin.40]|jgi:hypothetical protein|nr:hypothetical protein [Cyanobacteriota bacterium erpe_2018_sw_21hr_WHONDRS-SW48-000092_B_bin.40]